jgi:hypothetical protein
VHQGGSTVKAMTGKDQKGGIVGSPVTKDTRSPAELLASSFGVAAQKFGSAGFPFAPFTRKALSDQILTGDPVTGAPAVFPLSAQATYSLPIIT